MIHYRFTLLLILFITTIQGADQQKINFTFALNLQISDNNETSMSEINDEIDLTKKELNTQDTLGNLFAKAQARGTPWPVVAVWTRSGIDYFDLVELVRKYGNYSQDDFRSCDKTEEIINAAEREFFKENALFNIRLRKVVYEKQELPQWTCCLDYKLCYVKNSYHIKVTDLQAILALALYEDYVPAGALQYGLQQRLKDIADNNSAPEHTLDLAEKFWTNFLKQLPKETFQNACQQFAKAYPR